MSDEERFAKAAVAPKEVYGVGSTAELASRFKQMTADVNAVVRAALTARGGMRAGKDEMAAYMKGITPKAA